MFVNCHSSPLVESEALSQNTDDTDWTELDGIGRIFTDAADSCASVSSVQIRVLFPKVSSVVELTITFISVNGYVYFWQNSNKGGT